MNSAQAPEATFEPHGPLGLAPYDDRGDDAAPTPGDRPEGAGPLEVRRNGALAGMVGVLAAAVAIAWLGRATADNAVLDWAVVAVMALVAAGYLRAALDARTPLLIADAQGVRVRLGRVWRGLPWAAVDAVEHQPRRSLLRDGRLAIAPRDAEQFVADLDRGARRQARLAQRLYGAPLGVPLGPSTRLVGDEADLVAQLQALADASVRVVDVPVRPADPEEEAEPVEARQPVEPDADPEDGADGVDGAEGEADVADDEADDEDGDEDGDEESRLRDPRPWLARLMGGRQRERSLEGIDEADENHEADEDDEAVHEDPAYAEAFDHVVVHEEAFDETVHDDGVHRPVPAWSGAGETTGEVAEEPDGSAESAWSDRVRPIARLGQPVAPLVVDDFRVEPALDPVIGPDVAAARTRLGLTVDQLAERTRIRPHVIESIEVDDFAPCGGDFYARGHLRTLARVLGIDVTPLLTRYDARYAHAPVDARRVFEAELASAGARTRASARGRGGPNWSVLVAAFMAVVLCWSVAQLVLDTPPDVRPPTPTLRNGSEGVDNGVVPDADPVPVLIGAVQGGATIQVRDGSGETVFSGDVAYGESRALQVAPPVRVTSDDGGAVEVTVAGDWQGRMGRLGESATQTYDAGS